MAADTIPEVVAAAEEDPEVAITEGKRHLMVHDYNSAVSCLALGCQVLAGRHGDTADELGEPYLYYGKALLYLAREEAGVLGLGVPGNEQAEAEEDDGEDDEGEGEAEEAGEEGEKENKEEGKDKAESSKETVEKKDAAVEKKAEEKKTEEKKTEEKKTEEKAQEEPKKEEKADEKAPVAGGSSSSVAGSSKSEQINGGASTSGMNGHADGGDEGADDESNEEEEGSNLQLAWEVLELAKLIILKRGPDGWKLLADVHRLLGEVAMESGNQVGALTDLTACMDLLKKLEKTDPRTIAETHYQLGLAYSLGNEFDSSIEEFVKATTLLEERIKDLETKDKSAPAGDDPSYTVEHEIEELKALLPDIREKISDMKDFKQEACKQVLEKIKEQATGSCTNGAGPSSASGGSSSAAAAAEDKPASDISHLVRKKRKPEEELAAENASPCKKPTPEKV